METFTYNLCKMFFFHSQWSFVEVFHIQILEDMACRQVAEQGYLVFHTGIKRILGAAYDNIRLDSHSLQLLYACLGRLRLHFLGCLQIRYQCHVDQNDIFKSFLVLKLADGFKEMLAIDVSDGAADIDNGDLSVFCRWISVKFALDLIGNVGDDLNGTPAEVAAAFLLEHRPVDLSCRDV